MCLAGWAMIWTGLWAMWMKVSSVVCAEMCWSAPSRRPVNTRIAAPASAAGWSTTARALKTGCRWMLAASNHFTGVCLHADTGGSRRFHLLKNSNLSPLLPLLSLTAGTCAMTWHACKYAAWTQCRVARWSAHWRACTLTRTSASSPSFPALTHVSVSLVQWLVCVHHRWMHRMWG